MKFSKQIRFVAVKAWFDHYINFKAFKKLISQGKARLEEARDNGATEEEIAEMRDNFVDEFAHKLYKAMNGVTSFYASNYLDCQKQIDDIGIDIHEHLEFSGRDAEAERAFLKRVFSITLTAYELRTFLEINRTAGKKIVKKLVKKIGFTEFAQDFEQMETELFRNLPEIENLLKLLEDQYVTIRRDISLTEDTTARPEIVMELHNKVDSALAWKQSTVLTNFNALDFRRSEISVVKHVIKPIPVVIAFIILIAFSVKQFSSGLDFRAQKAIGIVGFCSVLWATGAVPLWLSSLCVPMWAVVLKVIPGVGYEDIGKMIEQSTMSSTVFLTMGGFTIAAALKQTEMDKRIATICLKKAASNRAVFLLVCSMLNSFIAMWISNITSTMIVVTLVGPTLRMLPTDSNYAKAVIFSIAVGGNLGGMLTPLASPQNAVTCEAVADAVAGTTIDASVSFAEFFETALPLGIVCALAAWGIVLIRYKIDVPEVPPIPDVKTDFGWRQIFVSVVSIAIIAVWITLPFGADKVFSDNGIVGFLPVIIFYGAGIIPPSQITELPWNIIFLLMGGNALSTTVQQSGLKDVVSNLMTDLLGKQSLWVSMLIINLIVLIIDFFLTHTVSSMITMPIVAAFAKNTGHLELYCMSACMATTASQILPVSSFPNMCCVSLQDDNKKEYITSNEMIKWGILITFVCVGLTMSVHYGIGMLALD